MHDWDAISNIRYYDCIFRSIFNEDPVVNDNIGLVLDMGKPFELPSIKEMSRKEKKHVSDIQ